VVELSNEEEPLSEETLLSIAKSKQGEAAIEQQMGYSPFRPHMTFANPNPNPAPSQPNTHLKNDSNSVLSEMERQPLLQGLESWPRWTRPWPSCSV